VAQLQIQKKQSSTWLWWVIGLVILAVFAWWFLVANHRETVVGDGDVVGTPAVVATTTPAAMTPRAAMTTPMAGSGTMSGGVITDLTTLTAATTAGALAGRPVALTNVPVEKAVSDKGFWAGTGNATSDHIFVVRGNQNASYSAPNGAVNAGKRVMIYGTVRAMPSDLTQQATPWNIHATDRQRLAAQPLYIMADSVRIAP
jgi:hypothetical protein